MKTFLSLLLLHISCSINAQVSGFIGTFNGSVNGDNLTMNLQKSGENSVIGKMRDSQQNYDVKATVNGSQLIGTAVEKTLNLTFIMNGQLNASQLKLKMTIEVLGQKQEIDVFMNKQGAAEATTETSKTTSMPVKFPSGATNDRNIVGTWVKSENYNSGSGDNFMGSSFQQKMMFFADGTVADGGSQANISGSNYSGSSQGGAQATPGVYWYNIGNQLYLLISQNGKTETAHLGRYFIENGAMLITGTNGKKLLLTRK